MLPALEAVRDGERLTALCLRTCEKLRRVLVHQARARESAAARESVVRALSPPAEELARGAPLLFSPRARF